MKSIKTKLIIFLGLLITVICVGISGISYINSSNVLNSNLSKTLPEIAIQTASSIQNEIEGELDSLEATAAFPVLSDPNFSLESKLSFLASEVKRRGCYSISYADTNGVMYLPDGSTANVSDRGYFKSVLNGNSVVSDPVLSKTSNDGIIVIFAVPITYEGKIVGALLEANYSTKLSDITNQLKFGTTGSAFMIKKDGVIIAHPNNDLVLKMYNPIEEAKKDTSLQQLANVETKMGSGGTGIEKYSYEGVSKFAGYAPIKGTEWSVAVVIDEKEIFSELNDLIIYNLFLSAFFIITGFVLLYIISNMIAKGIKSTSKHMELIAQGDLSKDVSPKYLKFNDEVGDMSNSMNVMQESFKVMIRQIKENSTNINSQSEVLATVSEEIANASQNVTEAISDIAEGTSGQSQSLVNATDILNDFSNKLSSMLNEIIIVDSNSREISVMAKVSGNDMNQLNESVTKVGISFKTFNSKIIGLGQDINEINEITNMINNIADQTNLLALNAAIEAARAGESGRGFSVVADEIRKLAEQSGSSSVNISRLINGISKNTEGIVEDSVEMDQELLSQITIIDNSIISFKKIIEAVNEVIPKIEAVKKSAEDIDNDKNVILHRVDEISSVSLDVSAASQEISASSEEMNASTEEVAAAAQTLTAMTKEMIEEVDKYTI